MATIEDYICQQLESSLRVKNKVTGMFEDVTAEGQRLMERSFKELGAGRSILVDRDGRIISGNKSQRAAMAA